MNISDLLDAVRVTQESWSPTDVEHLGSFLHQQVYVLTDRGVERTDRAYFDAQFGLVIVTEEGK